MTTRITAPCPQRDRRTLDGADLGTYKAWFKAERQYRLSQNSTHQHIWHVSQLLLEAARQKAFDGLILIAADTVATMLDDVLAPEARALLMGKIVRDVIPLEMPAPYERAALLH